KLAEIDADWRPAWPVDWQRAYAGVAQLLALGSTEEEIVPGVTLDGMDVGRWLQRQRQHVVWQGPGRGATRAAGGARRSPAARVAAGARQGLQGRLCRV
ncbi:helicase, partial [Streptomyces sp900105245]